MSTIFCFLLERRDQPFSIKFDGTQSVDDLKFAIKKTKEAALAGLGAHDLKLYRVDLEYDSTKYIGQAHDIFKDPSKCKLLDLFDDLGAVFGDLPARPTIHILVEFGESIDSSVTYVAETMR
jgi:hypothetical protein